MFTAQEKIEILKTVQASKSLEAGTTKLAQIVKSNPAGGDYQGAQRPLGFSISQAIEQIFWLNRVLQNLLWVFETNDGSRLERSLNITQAWGLLDSVIRNVDEAAERCSFAAPLVSAGVDFKSASNVLKTINRTLPYAEPFPSSYPKIIGPHGHYELAQGAGALSTKYLADTGMRFWPVFGGPSWNNTARANEYMGIFLENLGKALHQWNRVMGIAGEIVLPEDQVTIDFDTAAGTGLRPSSFFSALLAHQLSMAGDELTTFSGREVPLGNAFYFGAMLDASGKVLSEVGKVDPAFTVKECGSDGGVFFTIQRSWRALDQWSEMNNGFFFEIPAAPGGQQPPPSSEPAVIPPGYFAQQASALASIANQAEAVRLELISKEGQPV
jgi:hypothetical protein